MSLVTSSPPSRSTERQLFRIGSVRCLATPLAWLFPLPLVLLGHVIAVLGYSATPPEPGFSLGIQFAALLFAANVIHSLGHVAAALLVGIQNNAVIVTATVHINLHSCQPHVCSPLRHVARALRGPLANILAATVVGALAGSTFAPSTRFFIVANFLVAAFVVLPIPGLDGWVVWGEALGFRRRVPLAPFEGPDA